MGEDAQRWRVLYDPRYVEYRRGVYPLGRLSAHNSAGSTVQVRAEANGWKRQHLGFAEKEGTSGS